MLQSQRLNDAPTLTLPEAPTINEDASITFSAANNNAIILADDATRPTVRSILFLQLPMAH